MDLKSSIDELHRVRKLPPQQLADIDDAYGSTLTPLLTPFDDGDDLTLRFDGADIEDLKHQLMEMKAKNRHLKSDLAEQKECNTRLRIDLEEKGE